MEKCISQGDRDERIMVITKDSLFERREILSDELIKMELEYDRELDRIKKKHLPKINKLIIDIADVRYDLHKLGVPVEDC